jgi:oligopeptide transport system ATP-binding protein
VRGSQIGMIFQDPMSSLNPTMRIGDQIAEPLLVHRGYSGAQARARAIELLEMVRIPEAAQARRSIPLRVLRRHAAAGDDRHGLACKPALLIADEPTTALDVTIQAQILDLMRELQKETGMAIMLITHDLGVVARMADDVAVMYAGQVVEAAAWTMCSTVRPTRTRWALQAHAGAAPRCDPAPAAHRGQSARSLRAAVGLCLCRALPRMPCRSVSGAAGPLRARGKGHVSRCWLQHPLARGVPSALHVGGAAWLNCRHLTL